MAKSKDFEGAAVGTVESSSVELQKSAKERKKGLALVKAATTKLGKVVRDIEEGYSASPAGAARDILVKEIRLYMDKISLALSGEY